MINGVDDHELFETMFMRIFGGLAALGVPPPASERAIASLPRLKASSEQIGWLIY